MFNNLDIIQEKPEEQNLNGIYNWLTYAITQADAERIGTLLQRLSDSEIEMFITTLCDTKKNFYNFYQTHRKTISLNEKLDNIFQKIKSHIDTMPIEHGEQILTGDNGLPGRYIQTTPLDWSALAAPKEKPTKFRHNDTALTLAVLNHYEPTYFVNNMNQYKAALHYPGSHGLSPLDWAIYLYKCDYTQNISTIIKLIEDGCPF